MSSFIKCLIILSFQILLTFEHSSSSKVYFFPSLINTTQQIISNALSSPNVQINAKCRKAFENTIMNSTTEEYFVQKIIIDSSKNKNDFLTYSSCMSFHNISTIPPTYLFITISSTNDTSILNEHNSTPIQCYDYPKRYHFGLCVPSGCNESEYSSITHQIARNNGELFRCEDSDWLMEVFELNTYDAKFSFSSLKVFSLLPFLLIIIQLLLNVFPVIPYWLSIWLVQLIHKCKKVKSTFSKTNILKKTFLRIKKAFSIAENSEELFNNRKVNSKINNETGLTYTKGLRVIAMIFFLLGTVFVMIIQSPSYISSEASLDMLMKNFWFSLIFFGIRYAPRILLSCSGFSLTYKFMCYLDEQVDENETDDIDEDDSQRSSKEEARTYSELIKREKEKHKKTKNTRISNVLSKPRFSNGDVLFKFFFTFIKYQIHKYIITFVIMYFMKWSLYTLCIIIDNSSPLMEYYNQRITQQSLRPHSIVLQLLLVRQVLFLNVNKSNDNFMNLYDLDIFYDYYWLIFNEMICFVFSAFVVFICYREKYSLGHFCFGSVVFLLVLRIVLLFVCKYYPSHYFSHLEFGLYFICPFNNYTFYVIGIYFGMINYAFQKNITLEECEDSQRNYLMNSIHYIIGQQKNSKVLNYILGIGVVILTIVFSLSQFIFLNAFQWKFISNVVINLLYCVDIEIIVYLLHRVLFAFYVKGDNIIHSIAGSTKWEFWNKLYFCFILSLPSVLLFFLYQSDNRITLNFMTILYYSLNILVFNSTVACLLYVLFELPCKRLVKFWVNAKESAITQNPMIELNTNPSYQGEFNCIYDDDDDDDDVFNENEGEDQDNKDDPNKLLLNKII